MLLNKRVASPVFLSTLFIAFFFTQTHANSLDMQSDSITGELTPRIKSKFPYKQLILPSALITYGTVETILAGKVKLINYGAKQVVDNHVRSQFRVDDLTQYVPAASVYILNLAGIKGKNNFKDRTIILGISGLLVGVSVNLLKYTTKIERPDKSTRNSFPSGHAAVAFMGAEFLWQEYKDVSPWYGIAGYTIAAGTGLLRVYNDRHWFGDVVAGAGFGILSTRAAYWIYPMLQRKFSRKNRSGKNLVIMPFYNGQQGGLSLSVNL